MSDFFNFKTMITPRIIQVLYIVGSVLCILSGLGMAAVLVLGGMTSGEGTGMIFGFLGAIGAFLAYAIIGPIILRVYCEILILFFRMNETLGEMSGHLATQVELAKNAK